MSRAAVQPPSRPAPRPTTARVIRFGPAGVGGEPIRRYLDPVEAAARGEPSSPSVVTAAPQWPEPTDRLDLLVSPDRRPADAADPWLAPPEHPDAPLPAVVRADGGRLRWRPGRAVLEGPVEHPDDVVAGLVDFAFYEGQLRQLEAAVRPHESAAVDDSAAAYRVAAAGPSAWERLGRTMEQVALLRLTFARLEPRLARPSRSLPTAGRLAFARLCRRAQVEDRLAGVSDRIEACEDLYEGAVDRITDHGWWRKGHRLEAIIVGLLAIEGLQLTVELVLHFLQLRR